jgi:hypothetical protein
MMVLSMVASTENRRHILVFRREDGIMCIWTLNRLSVMMMQW